MPSPRPRRRWTVEAQRAWQAWWNSPMTTVWVEADTVALRRAVRLVDDIAAGRSQNHGALTALEDRLGLTPKARRQLQWDTRPDASPAPVVSLPEPSNDPRVRGGLSHRRHG